MNVTKTLPEVLAEAAKKDAGFFYLEEKQQERFQSYRELFANALQVAGSLYEMGLKKGDRVAIIVPESEAFLTSFFGVSVAGMIPVPMYPPMNLGQLDNYFSKAKHIIRAADAKIIITNHQVKPLLGTIQAECPAVRAVVTKDDLKGTPRGKIERVSTEAPSFIQFTSGSTSEPKGVVLSHANLAANVTSIAGPSGIRVVEGDVGISWLPLFHDMGLIGMVLCTMYANLSTVIMSPLLFLKRPVEWLRAMTRYKGTISFAPNFAYGLCVKRVKERDMAELDLSSWRVAGCGAEPIQSETLVNFAKKFSAVGFRDTAFLPCYGMAEHTLAITFPPLDRKLQVDTISSKKLVEEKQAVPCKEETGNAARFVNCGRPFPGHEIRIVNEEENELPERHIGEIILRGPSVMQGYDKQEILTKKTLRDQWLYTGDLGYLANGELYVCGRKKDMIIVNGRNYYPQDLEWVINDMTGVRKGNVVAFGSSAFGEKENIVLVVESKGEVEKDLLAKQITRRVQEESGLHIDNVVIAPPGTIPKTSSGKLQRAKTKALYESNKLLQNTSTKKLKLLSHLAASQWGYFKVFVNRVVPGKEPIQEKNQSL